MARRDNEGYSLALMALGTVLVMYTTYVHGYGLFRGLGLTDRYVDLVIASIRHSGLRGPVFIEKALSLFLFVTGMFLRSATSESRITLPQSAAVAVLGCRRRPRPSSLLHPPYGNRHGVRGDDGPRLCH